MSFASIGYQAKITYCATENGTYEDLLSEPTMIPIPAREVERLPATHLQSPAATKEYVLGLFDPQPISLEANFIKADFVTLKSIEGLPYWFKIESPDGYPLTVKFPGGVHKVTSQFEAEVVSKMTFEIQTTSGVSVV